MSSGNHNAERPHTVYDPVGHCIYCGALEAIKSLTDEHIMPLALGGRELLPKSSCEDCARIITPVEHHCCRGVFGDLRMQWGFPSRRKKDRPATINIRVETKEGVETRSVPVAENPAYTYFPVYQMPKLLRNRVKDGAAQITNAYPSVAKAYSLQLLYNFVTSDNEIERVLTTFPDYFLPFARMLAKISHAYCVARFGSDKFSPLLPDLILGKTTDYSDLVGGGYDDLIYPGLHKVHRILTGVVRVHKTEYLYTRVRLMAVTQAGHRQVPMYTIVVGTLSRYQSLALLSLGL